MNKTLDSKTCERLTGVCSSSVARFFSSSVVKELGRRGKSPIFARLLRESRITDSLAASTPLHEVFESAFNYLKVRDNRHEYVYKAAITQKVLLGVHNLNTASMLTEFRVGNCKADVVILNGTGTVYEIKSERDTLSRLKNQIAAYLKVFASVNVIVGENHVESVLANSIPEVGVMHLSNSFSISTVREPCEDLSRVCPLAIFDCVNLNEAEKILKLQGLDCPSVANTKRFAVLKELFTRLTPEDAHRGLVDILKKTRKQSSLESLLHEIPNSLHSAALTARLRKQDRQRFSNALMTTLEQAATWG